MKEESYEQKMKRLTKNWGITSPYKGTKAGTPITIPKIKDPWSDDHKRKKKQYQKHRYI